MISEEAIDQAAKLSDRYISDRYLPDKAIDLIDEASSRVRLRAALCRLKAKKWKKNCAKCVKDKEMAIRNQEFEKAASLREQETRFQRRFAKYKRLGKLSKNQRNLWLLLKKSPMSSVLGQEFLCSS